MTYPAASGRGLAVVPQQFRLLAPAGSLSVSVPSVTIRGAEEPDAKEAPMPRGGIPVPPEQRFWPKVDQSAGPDGCWLWLAALSVTGYGAFWNGQRDVRAHRFAYELLVGPIPDGLQIDHLCRVRHCVNPSHLEPVTARVNILRGTSPTAKNATKTHCPRGHPIDGAWGTGGRYCRTCKAVVNARWYYRDRRLSNSTKEGT